MIEITKLYEVMIKHMTKELLAFRMVSMIYEVRKPWAVDEVNIGLTV